MSLKQNQMPHDLLFWVWLFSEIIILDCIRHSEFLNLFSSQAKYISQCIDEIKQELKQDNIAVKANAVCKLTYVSAAAVRRAGAPRDARSQAGCPPVTCPPRHPSVHCPSACPFLHPVVRCMSVRPSLHLLVYCLSINSSIRLSIVRLSVSPSTFPLSVHPSFHPLVHRPSIRPSFHLLIHCPSVCPSLHLYIHCPSVQLSLHPLVRCPSFNLSLYPLVRRPPAKHCVTLSALGTCLGAHGANS